jgi:hypothetical protein
MERVTIFDKRRVFDMAVGPGKNPKLINVGPTLITDYRVIRTGKERIEKIRKRKSNTICPFFIKSIYKVNVFSSTTYSDANL